MKNSNDVTFDEVDFDDVTFEVLKYQRGVNRFFKSDLKYYAVALAIVGLGAFMFIKLDKK